MEIDIIDNNIIILILLLIIINIGIIFCQVIKIILLFQFMVLIIFGIHMCVGAIANLIDIAITII